MLTLDQNLVRQQRTAPLECFLCQRSLKTSHEGSNEKPAISTTGSAAGRQSLCQPHLPQIEAAVGVGLSAQRIYQDLVCEAAFTGSYPAAKRFVRHLRETQPIPFVRMEVEPGAEAQVDFGQGAWVGWTANASAPIFSGWS